MENALEMVLYKWCFCPCWPGKSGNALDTSARVGEVFVFVFFEGEKINVGSDK